MHRAAAVLVVLLAPAPAVSAGDGASTQVVDVASDGPLAAPPRVAIGADGSLLVALPAAAGIDVAFVGTDGNAVRAPVHAVRRSDLVLGGRRGPRIAARGEVVVLAAITRREKAAGGDLFAWRSPDGGATWGDAVRVNDVAGCAAEGLFDLAALGDGRFAVVWLDGREKGTRLVADFSADGAEWAADVVAYQSPGGSICECCDPAIAASGDGAVVAFRNSVDGARDVWTAGLPAGSTKFLAAVKSGTGSWKLAACPMAGPAIAGLGPRDAACAWRRDDDVFLVDGRAGRERDLGRGNSPQVAAASDGVHVFWIAKDALVHLAPGAVSPTEVARNAEFPCAARFAQDGPPWVVAWLDTASRRARLAIGR